MLGLATLGTGIEPPAADATAPHPPVPHRPRAGRLGGGLRRPSAGGLADAGDGSAVRRAGVGAAPLPRPPGAGGRRRASGPRQRAGARAALAQPAAGGPPPRSALARRHRARDRRARGRGGGAARRNRAPPAGRAGAAARTMPSRPPRSRSTAGWSGCCRSIPRSRSRSAIAASSRTTAPRDAAAGRTLDGPHLTDLAVVYSPKDIPAADASTGEQKALLIGLVLAHAGLLAEMTGFAPVLLLDEVVAHLDPDRRAALYAALGRLGAQVFMTGADPAAFADVAAAGRCVHREPRPGPSAAPSFRMADFRLGESSRNFRMCQGFNITSGRGRRAMKRQRAGEMSCQQPNRQRRNCARPLRACAPISTAWNSGPTRWIGLAQPIPEYQATDRLSQHLLPSQRCGTARARDRALDLRRCRRGDVRA